jgi:hypothetical protein
MKYRILMGFLVFLGFLVFPLASKAFSSDKIMGFPNERGLWDETGKQVGTCWYEDQKCLMEDNKIYTREELGLNPLVAVSVDYISIPESTSDTVYVPVYVPTNPVTNQPVGGTEAPVVEPDSTPTFTPFDGDPYIVDHYIASDKGDFVKFGINLTKNINITMAGSVTDPFHYICTIPLGANKGNPDATEFSFWIQNSGLIKNKAIGELSLGGMNFNPGHYSCKFKFVLPEGTFTSNAIEFELGN